jgi:hypothetical protein
MTQEVHEKKCSELTWFQLRARQFPQRLVYYSELLLEVTWEPLRSSCVISAACRALAEATVLAWNNITRPSNALPGRYYGGQWHLEAPRRDCASSCSPSPRPAPGAGGWAGPGSARAGVLGWVWVWFWVGVGVGGGGGDAHLALPTWPYQPRAPRFRSYICTHQPSKPTGCLPGGSNAVFFTPLPFLAFACGMQSPGRKCHACSHCTTCEIGPLELEWYCWPSGA